MAAPVVIVGSGLAGWTVARELRKLDAAVPIVLVTASPGHFYAKPTLSNALALARTPAQIVTTPAEQMATASGVTLLAETTVTGIDAVAHTLSLSDGQTLAYRDLVLANGAQPIVLPMAGNAAQRVYRVNHLEDFHGSLRSLHRVNRDSRYQTRNPQELESCLERDSNPHRRAG